ncbi:MAG: D-alanyl-D-alanine carboxypeptidase [Pyrinomonadaceae bacterium]
MKSIVYSKWGLPTVVFLILTVVGGAFGQPDASAPTGSATTSGKVVPNVQSNPVGSQSDLNAPLVTKTASVAPASLKADIAFPVLADVEIPGHSGILVQTLDGKTVVENLPDSTFNPASNVKIATAYAVLKTFGPDFRFPTQVWTDGTFDEATSTLHGNLYISGRDPVFGFEHGISIANSLNQIGIKEVIGDLIVTDNFAMNYSGSPVRSGQSLFAVMDASKRSSAATATWLSFLANSGKNGTIKGVPSITFSGATFVQPIPSSLTLVMTHESAPMKDIVKATLCYSNNFLSERLADMLGGAYAVARIVQLNTGVGSNEFSIQTASGLGTNRVTPTAMIKLLRTLRNELARNRMTFADIMPVAGIDKGTLENRFDTDFSEGSVVGKTGTLGNTDGGVSTLSGEINTRKGKLLFVIFNQRGSVNRFRTFQNYYVSLIQGQFGGAADMGYKPISLDARMARSRITYPASRVVAGN